MKILKIILRAFLTAVAITLGWAVIDYEGMVKFDNPIYPNWVLGWLWLIGFLISIVYVIIYAIEKNSNKADSSIKSIDLFWAIAIIVLMILHFLW